MTEREMEDLLWEYPEKVLLEPLKQFRRQAVSSVGRSDVVFSDRLDRLLVVEIKRGKLPRGAIEQLHDYFGTLKREFPERPVELMVVANSIPEERRLACERLNIEPREISEKRFRDVAAEVGYTFTSEVTQSTAPQGEARPVRNQTGGDSAGSIHFATAAHHKRESAWYAWHDASGKAYFLAMVNAKGNCSMRMFGQESGAFLNKIYRDGDFQEAFADYLREAKLLALSRQPNLEKHCRPALPNWALAELQGSASAAHA